MGRLRDEHDSEEQARSSTTPARRSPTRRACKRERRYIKNGHIWCFKLTNRTRDRRRRRRQRRPLHQSLLPAQLLHRIIVGVRSGSARRVTIRKGEELTYNYNTDGEGLIKCRCRPDCQTLL